MKRVVITGASGQLGRRLAVRLASQHGVEVHALTSTPAGVPPLLDEPALAGVASLEDAAACDRILAGADIVFHCAFARSHEAAALARSLAVAGRLYGRACAMGVGAIVNVSSQSVYGSHRPAASREGDPVNPGDAYALAKYAAELLLEQAAGTTGIPYCQLRLASLVGAGMDQRLVTRLVLDALAGRPLLVQGGAQRFSFLDMEDAVAGLAAMPGPEPGRWARIYNLGPECSHSLLEIAQAVARLVHAMRGIEVEVKVNPSSIPGDATLDSRAFFADFGFRPRHTLDSTVAGIIARHSA